MISDRMASVGMLAAGVAHEINNPIGYVHSNLGTLQDYTRDLFKLIEDVERALQATPGIDAALARQVRELRARYDLEFVARDLPQLLAESREGIERVKKIVVVPILSTRYNELMRQWEYIFGRRAEPEFITVKPVTHKAQIIMATPPEDHPLVGEILVDHALEISTNPAKESVIIVAHGASGRERDKDNPKELAIRVRWSGSPTRS